MTRHSGRHGPTGTVYRTVYDTLNRPVSHWVGTTDTHTTDDWTPLTNTGDMVDVQDAGYDSTNLAPAPILGSVPDGTGLDADQIYYVSVTLTINGVETPAGPVSVKDPGDSNLLTVSVPASATVPAGTSFNVYVGFSPGVLTKQATGGTVGSGTWQAPSPPQGQSTGITTNGALVNYSGVGNGDLTQVLDHPGGADADHDTQMLYDWRDRLIAEKQGGSASESDGTHRPIFYFNLDNLGEVTKTYRYDGDGVSLSDFADFAHLPAADAAKLVAETGTNYDDQGRAFETQVFNIDPGTHQANGSLNTFTWYDHRGDVMKTLSPGGLVQKYIYDGAGRETTADTTDGGGDGATGLGTTWADAGNVTGDIVLSQVETQYDSDGNPVFLTDREHFNNDTQTGPLGSPSSGVPARVYYSANYYDAADRLTDSVDFGTNGGTAITSPPSLTSLPAGSLHTNYQYLFSSTGEEDIVTDPRGIQALTFKDLLGRTTKSVAGHTNGSPVASIDQTTDYTYDGENHVLLMTAELPGGTNQQTKYLYGYSGSGGYQIDSNDLLAQINLPNPSTGLADGSTGNYQTYGYDNLEEQTKTFFDENRTIFVYFYDVLGRLTMLGDGFQPTGDSSVRSLLYSYDPTGQLLTASTYSGYGGTGTLLNQVQEVYNGLGQLVGEYQSHSGAVVIGTTPEVQYGYQSLTGSASDGRLSSITYPNARKVDYQYNAGLDSNISRVSNIADDTSPSSPLEAYSYLGLDTIVQRTRNNNTDLTYIGPGTGAAGDKYVGLDQFGRVVDQNWQTTSSGVSIDRFQYGYDADGNVMYKNNVLSSANSELYHASGSTSGYDALNRLVAFSRCTLGGSNDTITATHTITWNLDAVGNWSGASAVVTDGTAQNRTANARNEYTTVGSSTPTYDNNGNLKTDETGKQYVYDAWNRLKQVKDSAGNVLETYTYDALGRRITQTVGSTTTDLYYDVKGSVLEERQGSTTTAQYVWGLGYPDALIERDAGGVRTFAQQDANWNVTSLADTSGNVQERYQYDPYGSVTVLNANFTVKGTGQVTASGYNWLYLFQDGRIDTTSMLYHFRARDYSPTLGRWTEPDPLGYVDGANLYETMDDSPMTFDDPAGLTIQLNRPGNVGDWEKQRNQTFFDWMSHLLSDLCPCVHFGMGPKLKNAPGIHPNELECHPLTATRPQGSNEDDFCSCMKSHPGCNLVYLIMTSKEQAKLRGGLDDLPNGWLGAGGQNMLNLRLDGVPQGVQKEIGDHDMVDVLAHELTHTYQDFYLKDPKLSAVWGHRPDGSPFFYAEIGGVRGENQIATSRGHGVRKTYNGKPVPNPTDPYLPPVDCKKAWDALANGW